MFLKKSIDDNVETKYISWYELSRLQAKELENEFKSHDMGKEASVAMHICVVVGIVTFVFCALIIEIFMLSPIMNAYLFTLFLILMLLGCIIVVASTIEYHIKFNSWLKVKHKIIKK